jgi:hypothetical protein
MRKLTDKNGLPLYNRDRVRYQYKRPDGPAGFIDCEIFIKKKIVTLKSGYTTVLTYNANKNDLSENLELIGLAATIRSIVESVKEYFDLRKQ